MNTFLLVLALLGADPFPATVTRVIDGDTVEVVDRDNEKHRIRLAGIDAPESKQTYGREATTVLRRLIHSKDVVIEPTVTDRYGRTIGVIRLGERSINVELVDGGHAWWYRAYAKKDKALRNAEASAVAAKRGLWKNTAAIAPWDWRRGKRAPVAPPEVVKVWVSKTGRKYHREDCRYARKAKPKPLSEVWERLRPCKRCKPPVMMD